MNLLERNINTGCREAESSAVVGAETDNLGGQRFLVLAFRNLKLNLVTLTQSNNRLTFRLSYAADVEENLLTGLLFLAHLSRWPNKSITLIALEKLDNTLHAVILHLNISILVSFREKIICSRLG